MEPIKIQTTSWHYRLAKLYAGSYEVDLRMMDSCQYVRRCLRGVFLISLVMVLAIFLIFWPLTDLALVASVYFQTGTWVFETLGQIILTSELLAITLFCIVWCLKWLAETVSVWSIKRRCAHDRKQQIVKKPPSAASQLYKSFTEKYCVPILIEYPEDNKKELKNESD